MGFLAAAAVVILFISYIIIKNIRGSSARGDAPDISNPSSAPDGIGDKGNDSDEDGDSGD